MKPSKKLLVAGAVSAGLAAFGSSAHAARLLYYNFEDGTDTTINNQGTTATAGTLQNPGRASFVPGFVGNVAGIGNVNTGTALRLTPAAETNSADDPYVNTNLGAPALAASSGTYTMMAWVNLASNFGDNVDNMVFGQVTPGGPANDEFLHNGFRNRNVHFGHWGNDETSNAATTVNNNTWYHVAWVYSGSEAQMYLNGAPVTTDDTDAEGLLDDLQNITIGKTEGNNGNFLGTLDEIKMFDTALTQAQVQQEAFVAVPEPAGVALIGVGAMGLLSRRRRARARG
jgi:hypothetical protein